MSKSYYCATEGLGVSHMFNQPVELLARYSHLSYKDPKDVVVVPSGFPEFFLPPPQEIWRVMRFRGSWKWPKIDGQIETILDVIRDNYRMTPTLLAMLRTKLPSGFSFIDFNRQCKLTSMDVMAVDRETMWSLLSSSYSGLDLHDCCVAYDRKVTSNEFLNLKSKTVARFDFMRAAFEAVCMAFQVIRKDHHLSFNKSHRRALKKLKLHLYVDPEATGRELKTLAAECRAFYFGGVRPKGPLCGLVRGLVAKHCLMFSYIARALPPPLEQDYPHSFETLASRLTEEPVEENLNFRDWVGRWVDRTIPKKLQVYTTPSNSGCIPFTRAAGGHGAGYKAIIAYAMGKSSLHPKSKLPPESYIVPPHQGGASVYNFVEPVTKIYNRLSAELSTLLIAGCHEMMSRLDIIPVEVVYADEKGIKVRLPTKTLTCVNLIEQPLRKLADAHLLRDKRCAPSLGKGEMPPILQEPSRGDVSLSLDMTAATDCHPFYLTRSLYEELARVHPEARAFQQHFPKLFGPRLLFPRGSFSDPDLRSSLARSYVGSLDYGWPTLTVRLEGHLLSSAVKPGLYASAGLTTQQVSPTVVVLISSEMMEWAYLLTTKLTGTARPDSMVHRGSLPIPTYEVVPVGPKVLAVGSGGVAPVQWTYKVEPKDVIQGGGPMLTSVDVTYEQVMSALEAYSAAVDLWIQKINDRARDIGLGREYSRPAIISKRGAMMGDPTSWALLPLVSLYAWENQSLNSKKVATCGDDLLGYLPRRAIEPLKEDIRSLGGVVSDAKSFVHRSKGLFVEVPYFRGKPQKFDLLSSWVAPSGGSKGTVDWYSLPLCIRAIECARGGLWRKTRFRREWSLATKLGLPLGADPGLGGIRLKGGLKTSLVCAPQWRSYVSQMPLKRLLFGGGLSIVPPTDIRRESYYETKAFEKILDNLTAEPQEGSQSVQSLAGKLRQSTSLLLLLRGEDRVKSYRRPRVLAAARRFRREVKTKRVVQGNSRWGYEGLLRDYREKQTRYSTALTKLPFERHFAAGDSKAKYFKLEKPFVKASLNDNLHEIW